MSSVLVQMAVKNERTNGSNQSKEASDEIIPMAKDVNGVTLRALTIKNRIVPPFLETEMYLNFKNGLAKYSGLLEMALGYGVVVQSGATYALADGTKLGYYKSWRTDEQVWSKILPGIEKCLQEQLKYRQESVESTDEEEVESEDEE
jgi:hypothetical protein